MQKERAEGQRLQLLMTNRLSTLDSTQAHDLYSFMILGQTFEGLTRIDKQGNVVPGSARAWSIDSGRMTYTFHLRENARWSDGSPVRADDYYFAWRRTVELSNGAAYARLLELIEGVSSYYLGEADLEQMAVEAVDSLTLRVKLVRPSVHFLEMLAMPTFYPQQRAFVQQAGSNYGTTAGHTVFNGPFRLVKWDAEGLELERNDHYWNQASIQLETVHYRILFDSEEAQRLYETGGLDRIPLVRSQIPKYERHPDFRSRFEVSTGLVLFNTDIPLLSHKEVRRAMTLAIDGHEFAHLIYQNGSKGATGFIPPGIQYDQNLSFREHFGNLIVRHLDEEATAFRELVRSLGFDSMPKLTLLFEDGYLGKELGPILIEQWKRRLGLDVALETVPYLEKNERMADRRYELTLSVWGADYNDPLNFLDICQQDHPFNMTGYANPEYDALLRQARQEAELAKYMDYCFRAERLLMEDMPIGPLFFRAGCYLIHDYVSGWHQRSYGVSHDLSYTSIDMEAKKAMFMPAN
ncbi:peptide ABC transporter substrate-binding protein [Paenibacillus sp. PR3]|uniref:Peptide ABC transporter substrate-binding protein n=1 Tax=Paenibacillus terricola TaxID=2763503 RepID=A0ABR8MSU1_9BACL|nr:peptide ABC transporter substrate-binding protein [Paenibacillus terricola]MBD3919058.1 peptide ABC transporter substrate-binding protein [Paenibacillus terricola]